MKRNALQILMTAVLAFAFTGAFAQVADGDYVEYDANTTAPTNVEYVTAGATMGYYAEPDAVYHPDYNSTDGWALTTGFTWNWTLDAAAVAYDNVTEGTPANYVEITFPSAGDYVVTAQEEAPTTFGGCAGTTTTMNVTALPVPTASIVGSSDKDNDGDTNPDNTWEINTTGYDYHMCGDAAAEDLTVTITETGVPSTLASYAYSVQQRVVNIDVDGIEDAATESASTLIDHPLTNKYATSTADGGTETISTGAMPIVGGQRTKYEFTLSSASDVSGSGIVSAISHKSDYLAGVATAYAFGTTNPLTITYIVNPAPTTGPIYHIRNDWAL